MGSNNDEFDEVFQCQYCGRYASLSTAVMAWAAEEWVSSDDRVVFTVSVTCGPSCAAKSNNIRVAR